MIKAIETVYNGYRFRSRLEARWAVFFDTLGIKYEYEKEGYDLDGTWYLPDFWLPELDCWVEIKGQEPTRQENEKARLLTLATQKNTFILWGDLQPFYQEEIRLRTIEESKQHWEKTGEYLPTIKAMYHGTLGHKFAFRNGEVYWSDTFWRFTQCRRCKKIEIVLYGLIGDMSCTCLANYVQKLSGMSRAHLTEKTSKASLSEEQKEQVKQYLDEQTKALYRIENSLEGYKSPRLIAAYTAARQARFEHGEKG